jgi:hypothetical protein
MLRCPVEIAMVASQKRTLKTKNERRVIYA